MNEGRSRRTRKERQRRKEEAALAWWVFAIIAAVFVVVATVTLLLAYRRTRTVNTVVESKERVCGSRNGSCSYLVYTDAGTYKVSDSILILRFNSSDVYGQIRPCHHYRMQVYGFRFGLTSSYPNIASVKDEGFVTGCIPN